MGVHIDTSEVQRLRTDLAKAPSAVRAKAPLEVRRTLAAIERAAEAGAPRVTGALAASIGTDVDAGGLGGEVGPTVDYGAYVEYGTQPHLISPDDPDGVLAFPGGGGSVFAHAVNHPGNAPEPFMGPAFDRHAQDLDDGLGRIGEDVL